MAYRTGAIKIAKFVHNFSSDVAKRGDLYKLLLDDLGLRVRNAPVNASSGFETKDAVVASLGRAISRNQIALVSTICARQKWVNQYLHVHDVRVCFTSHAAFTELVDSLRTLNVQADLDWRQSHPQMCKNAASSAVTAGLLTTLRLWLPFDRCIVVAGIIGEQGELLTNHFEGLAELQRQWQPVLVQQPINVDSATRLLQAMPMRPGHWQWKESRTPMARQNLASQVQEWCSWTRSGVGSYVEGYWRARRRAFAPATRVALPRAASTTTHESFAHAVHTEEEYPAA